MKTCKYAAIERKQLHMDVITHPYIAAYNYIFRSEKTPDDAFNQEGSEASSRQWKALKGSKTQVKHLLAA